MKKLICLSLVLSLIMIASPVFAEKGASQQAYEHASKQAIFNRVSDWFATLGKSEQEKAKILQERKAKRAKKRAEKELRKLEGKAWKGEGKFKPPETQTEQRMRQRIRDEQEVQMETTTRETMQGREMGLSGIMGRGKGKK